MTRKRVFLSCALILIFAAAADLRLRAQDQPQQGQDQGQGQQTQDQQQQPKKKKGGFFGGLKAITGQSSEQQATTQTAGSKTIGEGQKIGEAQPTGADRQKVTAMEKYSVPPNELKKFQEDGHLVPKQ